MIEIIYKIIKSALVAFIPDAKLIDIDLAQYQQKREDAVRATPAIYIKLNDPIWRALPGGVQKSTLVFSIAVVTMTAYGDERDITDHTNINHLKYHDDVYKCLLNKRYLLSFLPEYITLAGTANDRQMVETITRTGSKFPVSLNNLIISSQIFEAVVYDYSAQPQLTAVLAQLDLHVHLVKSLDEDVVNPDDPAPKDWDYEGTITVGSSGSEVPEVGFRFFDIGSSDNYGTMIPEFNYQNYNGQIFLYYEQNGYMYASAPVSEVEINGVSYINGSIEDNMTTWVLSSNPFVPVNETCTIKVIMAASGSRSDLQAYRSYRADMFDTTKSQEFNSYSYRMFQNNMQDSAIWLTIHINPAGKIVRKHLTHIGRNIKDFADIAVFMCEHYNYNVDILEIANTPDRKYVDMLVNNEFVLEVRTLETASSINVKMQKSKWQHRYSSHSDKPLRVFIENTNGDMSHAQCVALVYDYISEHQYISGFYIRTGDSFTEIIL